MFKLYSVFTDLASRPVVRPFVCPKESLAMLYLNEGIYMYVYTHMHMYIYTYVCMYVYVPKVRLSFIYPKD